MTGLIATLSLVCIAAAWQGSIETTSTGSDKSAQVDHYNEREARRDGEARGIMRNTSTRRYNLRRRGAAAERELSELRELKELRELSLREADAEESNSLKDSFVSWVWSKALAWAVR